MTDEPENAREAFRGWSGRIRPGAICAIRRGDEPLACFDIDPATGEEYWFLPGGGMRFGETSRDSVIREVEEEIGEAVESLRLLGVLENSFSWDGLPFQEVKFVYEGRFADPEAYDREGFGERPDEFIRSAWIPADATKRDQPLFPPGLQEILESSAEIS